MADTFSFDVVSDFDGQELLNAVDQVKREIVQRYDLKNTDSEISLDNELIQIISNSEMTIQSILDILYQKATKRKLSLKIFEIASLENVSGNRVKQLINLRKGLNQETAKKISKEIRDQIKKVNVSIQGESLRVSSKSKNDLQSVINLLKKLEDNLDVPLQFENYR
tara:strand:- start:6058 stop:6555 length:498 start_codon:yes stop_codon:yes gene_type:complete